MGKTKEKIIYIAKKSPWKNHRLLEKEKIKTKQKE
jgi:hypothetical protein